MKLRVARHTTDLMAVKAFYTQLLNLQLLGGFSLHDGYDGVFLGLPGADWHLEFTVSGELPDHYADEDDLLVFYADNQAEHEMLIEKFAQNNIPEVPAKNPYWAANGRTYIDPDGYRVVLTVKI